MWSKVKVNGNYIEEIYEETCDEITLETSIKMLEYFQQEWQYRHNHFWNICIKFFVLNIIVTMLPFITEVFGITIDVSSMPSIIFPIIGCLISIFAFVIMDDESKKLMAVGKVKYRINSQMNDLYKYYKYVDDMGSMKKTLANLLPKYVFICHFIINIYLISFYIFKIYNV